MRSDQLSHVMWTENALMEHEQSALGALTCYWIARRLSPKDSCGEFVPLCPFLDFLSFACDLGVVFGKW